MSERLELTLQAFENESFVEAISSLGEAQRASERAHDKLWKKVYKNREADDRSPRQVSEETEFAIEMGPDLLDDDEQRKYAAKEVSEEREQLKEDAVKKLCTREELGLDDLSRWAISRHLSRAAGGQISMLGGVMYTLGHIEAIDAALKSRPGELLSVFGSYGSIASALNDGMGLRLGDRGQSILTASPSYTLGTLSASRDMLITNPDLTLDMTELDTAYAGLVGGWSDILTLGRQKKSELPKLLFGEPTEGPIAGDVYGMPENQAYFESIVERGRLVAGLALGRMTIGDPYLQRFEINPRI